MGGVLHPAQNIFSKIPNRMGATRATYIPSPNFWVGKMEGFISLLLDARTDFFIAHDKRYAMFAGSCEEDNNSSKLKRKEIHTCAWENTDFIIGQIEHITAIPKEEKMPDPALSDRKISKKDHVRLAVNVFVCNLDRGNDKKLAKKLFLSKKYIILILVSSCRKFL